MVDRVGGRGEHVEGELGPELSRELARCIRLARYTAAIALVLIVAALFGLHVPKPPL